MTTASHGPGTGRRAGVRRDRSADGVAAMPSYRTGCWCCRGPARPHCI